MVDQPNDRLHRYYAEKLWDAIPPIYRHEDGSADPPDVLRSLIEVLAEQAAIVRRSHDRLWDDQFIELCDDWAVPYLGDLVATRMVSALDRRARRVDVAKTIYYRRRAGTLAVLEELIADITDWEGVVVEEFRRLLRNPHGLDPSKVALGRLTGTPAHGLPDLRRPRGAQGATSAAGAFDEYHHLPDMRRNQGGVDGRYAITKLAFHLFRLHAFQVKAATPFRLAVDVNGKQRFSFDPSGRAIPLYQRRHRDQRDFEHEWRAAREWELPAPIRCDVLTHAEYEITEALILSWQAPPLSFTAQDAERLRSVVGARFADESRLRVRLATLFSAPPLGVAATRRILADSLIADCGKAALLPAANAAITGSSASLYVALPGVGGGIPVARELTIAGNLAQSVLQPADKTLVIDAENGLGYFTAGTPPVGISVHYHYGFAGRIGAGTYPRSVRPLPGLVTTLSGGGAIAAPVLAQNTASEITDNATYRPIADVAVVDSVVMRSADTKRPYLELAGDWTIKATQNMSSLVLEGLWIGGRGPRRLRLRADPNCGFRTVTLRGITLDPGGRDADGAQLGPVTLSIEAPIDELVLEACILGPIIDTATGFAERITLRDSIIDASGLAPNPRAFALSRGLLDVRRCTVFGSVQVQALHASELLATSRITVEDVQSGCTRFSAFPSGSTVPHPYRTHSLVDTASLFTSRRFGDAGYAQLSNAATAAVLRGGEDGTEIGAWNQLLCPIKLDSLRAKVDEFLPFGLIPLFITET